MRFESDISHVGGPCVGSLTQEVAAQPLVADMFDDFQRFDHRVAPSADSKIAG